jgi:hypothetical protein
MKFINGHRVVGNTMKIGFERLQHLKDDDHDGSNFAQEIKKIKSLRESKKSKLEIQGSIPLKFTISKTRN